jgi:hypothetical protein
MTLWLAIGLEALLSGHHVLPARVPPSVCAEVVAQRPWRSGLRRHRLRALGLAQRCSTAVDSAALINDPDPEIRLAGWLRLAASSRSPAAVLTRALTDPSPAVRLAVVQRATRRRLHLDRALLFDLAKGAPDLALRAAAEAALR